MFAFLRRLAVRAALFVCLAARPRRRVRFGRPLGDLRVAASSRTAGTTDALEPYTRVLPSGRIVSPAGKSVVTGMGALGVALTPDDRYAVVSNGAAAQG